MTVKASVIELKAGDTSALGLYVGATGLSNLDEFSSGSLYASLAGTAHVTAGEVTVSDSATKKLAFDPVGKKVGGGNAFDVAGSYKVHVAITWSDGRVTRHPGKGFLTLVAEDNEES